MSSGEDCFLFGCHIMWFGRYTLLFCWEILPLSCGERLSHEGNKILCCTDVVGGLGLRANQWEQSCGMGACGSSIT